MKKVVNFIVLLGVAALSFSVTSCRHNEPQMPKIRGREVTFSQKELENKLEKLTFNHKPNSYIDSYFYGQGEDIYNGEVFKGESTIKTIFSTNKDEAWTNVDYSYAIEAGEMKALVNSYESKDYTFFDINYTNNGKFGSNYDSYNIDITNGQYKIKKHITQGYPANTLYEILFAYDIHYAVQGLEEQRNYFYTNVYSALNEVGYEKLKFYETDTLFTVELHISLADLLDETADHYEVMHDFLFLDAKATFQKFDLYYIFVFEHNTLIEFGTKNIFKSQLTGELFPSFTQTDNESTVIIRYTDKIPKEINYDCYVLLDDAQQIKSKL